MKTKTINQRIFQMAKDKGLIPHSITNDCVLNIMGGKCIIANNKRELLKKIIQL